MTAPKNIYFVDDDYDDLLLLQEVAHTFGHYTTIFRTTDDMLKAIESGGPYAFFY